MRWPRVYHHYRHAYIESELHPNYIHRWHLSKCSHYLQLQHLSRRIQSVIGVFINRVIVSLILLIQHEFSIKYIKCFVRYRNFNYRCLHEEINICKRCTILGIILRSFPKSTIRCDNALIIVAEGTRRSPSEGCFPEVIRSIQQLAELLPALLGQADPIRSFQYVYNPLIARLSWHNLKLFPDAVIQRCPFSSSFNYSPLAILEVPLLVAWLHFAAHGSPNFTDLVFSILKDSSLSDLHSPLIIDDVISASRHVRGTKFNGYFDKPCMPDENI